MKKRHEIIAMLEQIRRQEKTPVSFDEEAIAAAYDKIRGERSGIAIKILTVLGGVIASVTILGSLLIGGLLNSGMSMVISAVAFIGAGLWLNKAVDKLIVDTASVCLFLCGISLLAFGMWDLRQGVTAICIVYMLITAFTLVIVQRYVISFLAILIFNGSVIVLILDHDRDNLVHLYITILVIFLASMMLKEAAIITAGKKLSMLYNPARMGLICSLTGILIVAGYQWPGLYLKQYAWLSAIPSILAILFITPRILHILGVNDPTKKWLVITAVLILLLPTVFAPGISGSLLIMLLCFMVHQKTGMVIGILSFIYFISQYYYDLNLTLLTKSILLIVSGVLFLLLYFFTHKKLDQP